MRQRTCLIRGMEKSWVGELGGSYNRRPRLEAEEAEVSAGLRPGRRPVRLKTVSAFDHGCPFAMPLRVDPQLNDPWEEAVVMIPRCRRTIPFWGLAIKRATLKLRMGDFKWRIGRGLW